MLPGHVKLRMLSPDPPGGNDTGTCHERTLPARRAPVAVGVGPSC